MMIWIIKEMLFYNSGGNLIHLEHGQIYCLNNDLGKTFLENEVGAEYIKIFPEVKQDDQ